MEKLKITADVRSTGQKGLNRRLRKSGTIPAVLYGQGGSAEGLSVNAKDFTQKMKGAAGLNALIDLEFSSESKKPTVVVMVKEFQVDSISRAITHIDLLKINMKEKLLVKVPVHLTGKCLGVTKGGLIEQLRRELEVKCLPDSIPSVIEVDITDLDLGHSLHVKELKLPQNVELPSDVDFAIVSIVAPREEEAAPEVAAAEAAPGAAPVAGAETAAAPTAGAPAKAAPAKGDKK